MPPRKRGTKSRDEAPVEGSSSSAVTVPSNPLPPPLTTRESMPRVLAAMSRQSSLTLSISSSSADSASKVASGSQSAPPSKRRRVSKEKKGSTDTKIEEPEADSIKALSQSETAAESKKEEAEKPPPELLSTYSCPICFSAPTNATLTPCGHICCGECLFTAVRTTVQRAYTHMSQEQPLPRYFRKVS